MSSYQALYRRWRPRTFSEMVGQDAVRRVLRQQVQDGQISHAYLFCGTRGTGKTSAAKILAKAVNCLNPQQGNPCNACALCTGIEDGSVLDVVEIDAASNNGVDSVREIREEVLYTPAVARYRVYIIDEVHMLTGGAFNALLKTLEEPPPHVIFVLATTELHKIPATILSRCQCFLFARIPQEVIAGRLMEVARDSGIALAQEAAELIARLADGALRDALSILDQCAVGGGRIDVPLVEQVGGLTGRGYLFEVSQALAARQLQEVLRATGHMLAQSKDPSVLTGELLTHLRDLLIYKLVEDPGELLSAPPSEFGQLAALAGRWGAAELLQAVRTLTAALDAMARTPQKKIVLELALLELASPALSNEPAALLARIEGLERRLAEIKTAAVPMQAVSPPVETGEPAPQTPAGQAELAPAPAQDEAPPPWEVEASAQQAPPGCADLPPEKASAKREGEPAFWQAVLSALDPSISGFLTGVRVSLSGDVLTLDPGSPFVQRVLSKQSVLAELTEKVCAAAGRAHRIRIERSAPGAAPENPLFERLADRIDRLQQEDE
ncbi:MAG: DNA polymerase III subunit gamma/tau [Clostridiales bacterium]|nr:DNA polymerase III subunit gamma/tau [Clostridiales bacterium]